MSCTRFSIFTMIENFHFKIFPLHFPVTSSAYLALSGDTVTQGWMTVWGDKAADGCVDVRVEGRLEEMHRQMERQPSSQTWAATDCSSIDLRDWSIRCSIWNIISHYQVVRTHLQKQKRHHSSCIQCMQVAFHISRTSVSIFARFLSAAQRKNFPPIQSNPPPTTTRPTSCCKQQLQHFKQLHSPFPCIAPFCACVCVLSLLSVHLKGLWFQRRPLYFLHCLATITKASAPLLQRLSTWIACCLFLLFKIVL